MTRVARSVYAFGIYLAVLGGVRLFAFATLVVLALLHIAPPLVAAFGVADLAGALWTYAALRTTALPAPAV